ncbi:toll-like receptor 7 isoform X1 [Bradysia coprophila]|uniref:toll-like receptor 7 isoform X1 n=1 Tax=Bradysia coprophila TaxID=38358 RepID=UPI00187D951A|nr:toll-like receptor 7 isoform X1 [Bradysia coprophila]
MFFCIAIYLLRHGLFANAVFVVTIGVSQVDVSGSQIDAINCGTVIVYKTATIGGAEVAKDEWPFMAALYYSATFKYFCGGTIISQKHVLTAAHCIQTKGKGAPLTPAEISVRLGAYNLTDRSENDAVNKSIVQILVHPDWKVNEEKYDADIAILVLIEVITFSNHIRPVCMPPADYLLDGLPGTVVGWGKTENGTAEGIPRKIEVNALNDTYCYERDDGIARYVSERSFCAEGSGTPNEGDSGGGFFAVAGSGWVQFGTVSFVRPKGTGNVLKVASYVKLPSLRDWIAAEVEQSGGKIGVSITKDDLNCFYIHGPQGAYGCLLVDLNIRQEHFVVTNFTGWHHFGKGNEHVEIIMFFSGVMASLPRNVGAIFTNLTSLIVSVDTRRISRSNFQNLTRLELILFHKSSVAEFDENSLWDLPNLETFSLENSKLLKLLHAATFSRNSKLREVVMKSNALQSLPRNLFQNNSLLESVSFDYNSIETIGENIFESNANLVSVALMANRLRHFSKNVFRNNTELQFIDLSNNRIKTVDEQCFAANSKLLSLHLESNALEFLPEHLLQGMAFLIQFNARKNALKVIDERFFETNVRIEEIDLQFNQLTHIPDKLFRNNPRLQFVNLDANFITAIDENLFDQNPLLQNVSFPFNLIVTLPAHLFRHNPMLDFVNADLNSLRRIDERTFEFNSRLREIRFSGNLLSSIPGKLFENNPLLESVNFNSNALRDIDEQLFRTNRKLEAVFLSTNMLSNVPENLFRNNPLLKIVNLSGNLFTTLNANIFNSNSNLEQIFLRGVGLQSLPRSLFESNYRLKHIDLRGSDLRHIRADFTVFKHVNYINLAENRCIDNVFHDDENKNENYFKLSNESKDLMEFQAIVVASCS